MSKIIISVSTTYQAEAATKALFAGGFVVKTAHINYNLHKGIPLPEEIDNYPLILEGRLAGLSTSVHVNSVTAGYGGTGPNALVDILQAAEFEFEENDILTPRLADSDGLIQFELTK